MMDAELKRDLDKLSKIPDSEILAKARSLFVEKMAKEFQVPVAVMEIRIAGMGPFLQEGEKG